MRRPMIAAATCAVLMLSATVAHAAPPRHGGDDHPARRGGEPSARADAGALSARAAFRPLGARLATGTATVYGTLRDSYGTPTSSAWVEAWSKVGTQLYWAETQTDAGGNYSIAAAAPSTQGEVWAYPGDDSALARTTGAWATGGSYQQNLYPGRVSVTAYRGGRWGDSSRLSVRLHGGQVYSRGTVYAADTTSPITGDVEVLNGSYDNGSVRFFLNEGVEFKFNPALSVTSGTPSGYVTVYEQDAQRLWVSSPYWHSGKPGATVKVALDNFPSGWINSVTGYTDDPKETASKSFGNHTSTSPATQYRSYKIPATAKPGYTYYLGFQHVDGAGDEYPLYLESEYQVCTMKPSKTSVKKGARIRVTGVVPVEGHWGARKGKAKTVTLYAHKGTAKVPTKWDPKGQGWVKVGSVRTNGLGAFTTPYFKPLKTLTLVVRYPGDNWYYRAYTSTAKVTVK